ncbi:c-type cytochrome [Citreimonas salinaria]|uniref:Cytochrome c556 n=1 Tax=Citreimonas salinaria TaxID=321339 RepID=A0A1H3G7G0_9RHOB|nr:cytochrome c [Citreimonas salinaria]SDX99191.1 Cytochrome c556 [Citreimonas salinaria]
MKTIIAALSVAGALAVTATASFAQDVPDAVKARQGQFRIMAINLGILGDMARGKAEYDAEAAQNAADTLVAISGVHQPTLWPEGTDTMSIDGTRAEPALWDNLDEVLSKWSDFGEAAAQLQTVAADGQEAIGPAIGRVGDACKACHDEYRAPE